MGEKMEKKKKERKKRKDEESIGPDKRKEVVTRKILLWVVKVHERRQDRLATSKYSSFPLPKGTFLSSETSLGRWHVTHVSCCNENGEVVTSRRAIFLSRTIESTRLQARCLLDFSIIRRGMDFLSIRIYGWGWNVERSFDLLCLLQEFPFT